MSVWRLHHSYQDAGAAVLAAAQWSPDELELTWHFLEAPFTDRLRLGFDEGGVTVAHEVNVNAGPTALAPVRGVRR